MVTRVTARVAASAGLALALLAGPAVTAEAGTSKPFVSTSYSNALAKCQAFQTDLRRAGYVVTQTCTYVRWSYSEHAFVVTWRS